MLKVIGQLSWTDWGWLCIVVYVGWYINMLLHEFGHFVVAKFYLSLHVTELEVGQYITLYDTTHSGTRFVIRAIINPFSAQKVRIAPTSEGTLQLALKKGILLFAAGILVNMVIALVTFTVGFYAGNMFLLIVSYLSVCIGIGEMIPIRGTDGWFILNALRLRKVCLRS